MSALLIRARAHSDAEWARTTYCANACGTCGADAGENCRHTWHTIDNPNHKIIPCEGRGGWHRGPS